MCKNKESCLFIKIVMIILLVILLLRLIYPYTRFYYYRPIYVPFSKRLNKSELVLKIGESSRLRPVMFWKKTTYKSSDFRIAEVKRNGKVYAHRAGKVMIHAEIAGKKASCFVYVVKLNKEQITVRIGETCQLDVKGINDHNVIWKCKNEEIATIDEDGMVSGIGAGTVRIDAIIKDKTLSCMVSVH